MAHDFLETTTRARGRLETRRYWIVEDIGWLSQPAQWENLRSVGLVESLRAIVGQRTSGRCAAIGPLRTPSIGPST